MGMRLVDVDVAMGCKDWPGEVGLKAMAGVAFSTAMDVLELDDHFNVSLLFTSDAVIQKLNQKWRGKDKPTNVLSFPAGDSLGGSPAENGVEFLGDIALALETVQREAVDEGKTFEHHLTHLLVHGFLHLCGYDHETGDEDADEMETLERAILARLAIADPYAVNED
jgi:probable rRNA maturation factor